MANEIEILIKAIADVKGLKLTQDEINKVKDATKGLTGATASDTKETEKHTSAKHKLHEIAKGLRREFPALAHAVHLLTTPIGATIAAMAILTHKTFEYIGSVREMIRANDEATDGLNRASLVKRELAGNEAAFNREIGKSKENVNSLSAALESANKALALRKELQEQLADAKFKNALEAINAAVQAGVISQEEAIRKMQELETAERQRKQRDAIKTLGEQAVVQSDSRFAAVEQKQAAEAAKPGAVDAFKKAKLADMAAKRDEAGTVAAAEAKIKKLKDENATGETALTLLGGDITGNESNATRAAKKSILDNRAKRLEEIAALEGDILRASTRSLQTQIELEAARDKVLEFNRQIGESEKNIAEATKRIEELTKERLRREENRKQTDPIETSTEKGKANREAEDAAQRETDRSQRPRPSGEFDQRFFLNRRSTASGGNGDAAAGFAEYHAENVELLQTIIRAKEDLKVINNRSRIG